MLENHMLADLNKYLDRFFPAESKRVEKAESEHLKDVAFDIEHNEWDLDDKMRVIYEDGSHDFHTALQSAFDDNDECTVGKLMMDSIKRAAKAEAQERIKRGEA